MSIGWRLVAAAVAGVAVWYGWEIVSTIRTVDTVSRSVAQQVGVAIWPKDEEFPVEKALVAGGVALGVFLVLSAGEK